MRRGFTIVELLVAMVIGLAVMIVAYGAMHLMIKAEEGTDKRATRAMAEARLSEMLMRDLRSSVAVTPKSTAEYTITRYVMDAGKMVTKDATWKVLKGVKVTRDLPGDTSMTFDFDGLLDPNEPAFKFRVDRPLDVLTPDRLGADGAAIGDN